MLQQKLYNLPPMWLKVALNPGKFTLESDSKYSVSTLDVDTVGAGISVLQIRPE